MRYMCQYYSVYSNYALIKYERWVWGWAGPANHQFAVLLIHAKCMAFQNVLIVYLKKESGYTGTEYRDDLLIIAFDPCDVAYVFTFYYVGWAEDKLESVYE